VFTGIIEEVGTVARLDLAHGGARLEIEGQAVVSDARPGDSIAVSGVCLTVTDLTDTAFAADAMAETVRLTTLGRLRPGSRVNLERAVRADQRLGGHLVQGHVDGVATLASRTPGPAWEDMAFRLPRALAPYVALKGSIAVNGVSLTVTQAGEASFGIGLIPATLAGTMLADLAPGDPVNIEVDVIAKYVERLLAFRGAGGL
jgi:riboflavin synthase